MFFSKKSDLTIANINRFFNMIDQALLVFKSGVKDYLYTNTDEFNRDLETMSQLESEATILRREIEGNLYAQSALVRFRGDIMRLLETMDHIIANLKNSLFQFEIETPNIPSELNTAFTKLTELSTLAVACAIPAAKAYFTNPEKIAEKINRVYFYEKETDKQAQAIKRKVFHEMDELKLSEKFHLRYFALHIENLSDAAEKVADQLSVMTIKQR